MGLIRESTIGRERYFENILCFFGNHESSKESIQIQFPHFDLRLLKQVHGDRFLECANGEIVEGDGHWTVQEGVALGLITADCIPVFIWSTMDPVIAALHAGWRGVEQELVPKALKSLLDSGRRAHDLRVAIGPHIRVENFEMGRDAAENLIRISEKYKGQGEAFLDHPHPEKIYVNLTEILIRQIASFDVSPDHIVVEEEDTMTNERYHSYRRDGTKAGRQISFITRAK